MSDLTTYRIVDYDPEYGESLVFVPGSKMLVPDSRLQDIAEAWNEWKMRGASHETFALAVDDIMRDALTQEDNEPLTCQHRYADGAECGQDVLGNDLCKFGHRQ